MCAPLDFVNTDFPASFVTYAGKDFFCGGQGPKLVEKLKELGVHVEEYGSVKFMDNHCFSLTWKSKAAKANNDATAPKAKSDATRMRKGERQGRSLFRFVIRDGELHFT